MSFTRAACNTIKRGADFEDTEPFSDSICLNNSFNSMRSKYLHQSSCAARMAAACLYSGLAQVEGGQNFNDLSAVPMLRKHVHICSCLSSCGMYSVRFAARCLHGTTVTLHGAEHACACDPVSTALSRGPH
jgi:hypothetical protein